LRLVWGDNDWATLEERVRERRLVQSAAAVTILDGGHFLPLDRPDAVVQQIEPALYSAYLWPKKADANFSWNN